MSYIQPASAGRRSVGITIVVVFHIVLFYALVSGLARKVVEVVKAPLETKIIEEVKPPEEAPPPPPPPKLAPPPPAFIPPPEVRLQNAPPPPAETISTVTQQKPTEPVQIAKPAPVTTPAPAAPPSNFAAVMDKSRDCTPQYPRESLAREESGTTGLLFLIDVDGKPLEGKVEKTSGFKRLDEAARKALMNCRYKPAMVNGQAVQAWGRLEFEWKLDE